VARKRDCLYRREGGIFAFRYKDATGAWREKYSGETDREEAKKFRSQFLKQIEDGTLPGQMADWTLERAAAWWLEFRKPRIAAGTLTAEQYRLKPMIRILGSNTRLKQITALAIDRYTTTRLGEDVGAWSINKEVMVWSMILKKAKLWRRIAEDYQPLKTHVSDIGRALTRDQLRALATIAATDEDWEAAFYGSVLAASTGLRGGEIKKLRIGEIEPRASASEDPPRRYQVRRWRPLYRTER
jgi:hypothetical protein